MLSASFLNTFGTSRELKDPGCPALRMRSRVSTACVLVAVVFKICLLLPVSAGSVERVLYLGDSMSMGEFGRTLDKRIRDAGMEAYTFVAGGATPYYWLSEFSPPWKSR